MSDSENRWVGQSDQQGERLGIAFLTDAAADDLIEVEHRLRRATGVAHWIGTTGMGVCGGGQEYFDTAAAAVLVARLPTGSFRIYPTADDPPERRWSDGNGPAFGLVHADPHTPQLIESLQALAQRTSSGFLVGGLTSSRGPHGAIANGLQENNLSGVLFDSNVTVSTRLTQGCAPIGPARTITRSNGNLLLEIDGQPALQALIEDIGEPQSQHLAELGGIIFAALPIRGSDMGDYLVRNLIGIDPDRGMLAIAESVRDGDRVLFCRRDRDSARDDLRHMLRTMAAGLERPPVAGIYYTCLARGPNLFDTESEELRLIEQELGRFPLVGFFGNGEISHDRLYAYTGVLTLFS